MTFINDPDYLDRFQVTLDPVAKTISLRGSGTLRVAASTGSGNAAGAFVDSTANVGTAAVVGDVLAVVNDPNNNGGVIGHYTVLAKSGTSGIILDRSITQTGGSNIAYKLYSPGVAGTNNPSLADGVTMQCLYSFLKEEWRENSLSASGEDLIKYTFPMVSITSEQFEIGGPSNSNWEFADDSGDGPYASESPRNLIRTGGWASINESGVIIENYPSIVTLGSLDSNAQVYYQLTNATTAPTDFVLPGAVNQAIKTLETAGGVSTTGDKMPVSGVNGGIVFVSSDKSIRAPSANNLSNRGFTVGELIQVRQSSNNNGLFTITGYFGTSGVTVSENIIDESAGSQFISPLNDNRNYLVLRVRKKGKSYAQSEIADIGVTQINTIVNRFPLAHVDDPAITLSDGQLGGDDTDSTLAIQSVETFNTASDGSIGSTLVNGAFTFTSSTGGFLNGAGSYAANNVLQPGDSIEIQNSGFFEIKSIDSDTQLTIFSEPTGTFTGGGTSVTFTTKTATLDSGSPIANFYWETASGQATLDDPTRSFNADGGLGARAISSGDILQITSTNGNTNAIGYYAVESLDSSHLFISSRDLLGSAQIAGDTVTYRVLDNGMFLQYKNNTGTPSAGVTTITSTTLSDTDFTATNGYYEGAVVTITNANVSADNGTYIITDRTGNVITLVTAAGSTPNFTSTSLDVSVAYGFIRSIGGIDYSFNWRLFGNGGTLAQCFQFLQRELRRATDIDGANTLSRGDITDLLMSFASPNATSLNLFIDDVNSAELNNLTQQDSTDTNRNYPFLVTLRISLNNNITSSSNNKIVVFFRDAVEGNNDRLGFGTPNAVIVQTNQNSDMSAINQTSSPLDFTYDYTAGGNVDRDITVVCITDNNGQYVQANSVITESNVVNISLVAGLERNYSNPV